MKIHGEGFGSQNTGTDINNKSRGIKHNLTRIDTRDRLSISKPDEDNAGIMPQNFAHIAGKAKTNTGDNKATSPKQVEYGSAVDKAQEADRDVSITIPFDKHIGQACDYILDKTESQYPGFKSNNMGKSRKAHQIRSHLTDFVEYIKEKRQGDLASLTEKERKNMVHSATEFIADKIGDEYGMAPHMRRNAIFLSGLFHNYGDVFSLRNVSHIT